MKPHSHSQATLRLPRRQTDRGDIDFLPPSHARLVAVAVGLEHWTALEQAWLAAHPHWLEYERQFREIIGTVGPTEPDYERRFREVFDTVSPTDPSEDASTTEWIISCVAPSFSFRL
jgi:hypothetical protein